VVRGAFGVKGHDGEEEVDIVARTWALAIGPVHLDLVAVDDGAVVAHALGAVGDLEGTAAVAVAPLCVAPSRQGEGIGSALMTELIARADAAGWPMLLLLGDPRLYQRFGFEPARPLGIYYRPVGRDNPHFQVRRLARFDTAARGEFTYCWEGERHHGAIHNARSVILVHSYSWPRQIGTSRAPRPQIVARSYVPSTRSIS
jgi:predicted N-acetyltransferase YhbS